MRSAMNNLKLDTVSDIEQLEMQVDDLLRFCKQLQEENRSLREKQKGLVNERATLIEKNERARLKIDAMLTRLRSMEHEHG